jgi:hypothetical protein
MSSQTNLFLDAFDVFWDYVRQAEEDIETHRGGRLPPICHGDPWNDDFAYAYDAIQRYLGKFRCRRFFVVPVGLPFRGRPIQAETAHQALMYFLNPSRELYGDAQALSSPEYLAIKKEALEELAHRNKSRKPRWKRKETPCSVSSRILGELATLRGYIFGHHFPPGGGFNGKTLTGEEIAKAFNWSQTTASRRMQVLLKRDDGMAAYNAIFDIEMPPEGYRRRLEDGTIDVEARWRKRASEDEEEEVE